MLLYLQKLKSFSVFQVYFAQSLSIGYNYKGMIIAVYNLTFEFTDKPFKLYWQEIPHLRSCATLLDIYRTICYCIASGDAEEADYSHSQTIMYIWCFCCIIIFCLWRNVAEKYSAAGFLLVQKKFFGILRQIAIFTLQGWNHDKGHVHILFKRHPKSEISKIINAYKNASSTLLKKKFLQMRQKLLKGYFELRVFVCLSRVVQP